MLFREPFTPPAYRRHPPPRPPCSYQPPDLSQISARRDWDLSPLSQERMRVLFLPHACLTYFRDTLKPSLGILELDGSDELQREREKPGPPKGPKSAAGHIDSATQRIRPWMSEREESRDPPPGSLNQGVV